METKRLRLRPFLFTDAPRVALLAGDRRVAFTTSSMPHPYEESMALEWIKQHERYRAEGSQFIYAVETKEDTTLIGAAGLIVVPEHRQAELGYWIGVPYWGKGYATEAAGELLKAGFEMLSVDKIFSRHYGINPASGRVLEKIGMTPEGRLREHFIRFEVAQDLVYYGMLRSEFEKIGEK